MTFEEAEPRTDKTASISSSYVPRSCVASVGFRKGYAGGSLAPPAALRNISTQDIDSRATTYIPNTYLQRTPFIKSCTLDANANVLSLPSKYDSSSMCVVSYDGLRRSSPLYAYTISASIPANFTLTRSELGSRHVEKPSTPLFPHLSLLVDIPYVRPRPSHQATATIYAPSGAEAPSPSTSRFFRRQHAMANVLNDILWSFPVSAYTLVDRNTNDEGTTESKYCRDWMEGNERLQNTRAGSLDSNHLNT